MCVKGSFLMVKHLGSEQKKIPDGAERDKNETRICRVLSLFGFAFGQAHFIFAHFLDRTSVASYFGNELFTSALYYPSISNANATPAH